MSISSDTSSSATTRLIAYIRHWTELRVAVSYNYKSSSPEEEVTGCCSYLCCLPSAFLVPSDAATWHAYNCNYFHVGLSFLRLRCALARRLRDCESGVANHSLLNWKNRCWWRNGRTSGSYGENWVIVVMRAFGALLSHHGVQLRRLRSVLWGRRPQQIRLATFSFWGQLILRSESKDFFEQETETR